MLIPEQAKLLFYMKTKSIFDVGYKAKLKLI